MADRICTIEGCGGKHSAKGLCNKHYVAARRAKHPEGPHRYNRARHVKTLYGIELEEVDAMEREQGGVCAICRQTCNVRRSLAVDHDHQTGKVRGLLCQKCNRGLGLFNDDPGRLAAAIDYLKRTS